MSISLHMLFYPIVFAVFICTIVTIHELARFLVARFVSVKAVSFSYGLGPELVGLTSTTGTRWKLKWIPVWARLRLMSDKSAGSFYKAAFWKRFLITLAGPASFIIIVFLYYALSITITGERVIKPVVGKIIEGSPAQKAGLQAGDIFQTVNGKTIGAFYEMSHIIQSEGDKPSNISVRRKDQVLSFSITPVKKVYKILEITRYQIGVVASKKPEDVYTRNIDPLKAASISGKAIFLQLSSFMQTMGIGKQNNLSGTQFGILDPGVSITKPSSTEFLLLLYTQNLLLFGFVLMFLFPFLLLWQEHWKRRTLAQ